MEAEEGGGQGGAGARREELAASSKRGAPQHKGSRPAGARHRRSWQQISSKLGSRGEERGEVLGTTSARRATTQVRRSCAVIALCSFHFVGRWGLVCFCGFRQAVCRPSGMCVCVSFCRHSPFWPQQSSKHGYQNMLFADTVLLDPASRASKVIKHFVLQTRPSADPLSRTGPLAHPEAGLFSTPFLHNPPPPRRWAFLYIWPPEAHVPRDPSEPFPPRRAVQVCAAFRRNPSQGRPLRADFVIVGPDSHEDRCSLHCATRRS